MRVTGGSLRGRPLAGKVLDGVRPTPSRVREALFSMIGQDLRGQRVLDAFGGTGLLSFEALSRGAAQALIIDSSRANLAELKRSVDALGLSDRVELRLGQCPGILPRAGQFELIFLDPPYAMDPAPTLAAVAPLATGWVVLEHERRRAVDAPPGLVEDRLRDYGDTSVRLYRPAPSAVDEGAAG
ncbi:RsmD family RNA methyltransferase [Myxococcota bacterium]|nr:RsmD family RNA methyltransferase [Myxococcota bacterium]